ncbi:MAG: hypothetical protein SPF04_03975 [Bacilli bacterium]|nr:hypothetical protein [Bacilli bacterium]
MKKIEKNKLYMVIGIIILILSIAGSAYAYYSASASSTISGTAGGGNLTLKVDKLSTNATKDLIPLDNTTDMLTKAAKGYGNNTNSYDNSKSCIDKNGYTVCQVYKITITNNSGVAIVLNGGVSLRGDNTPNIECAVMNSSISVTNNSSCQGSSTLAKKYSLGVNSSKEYYILVYINNKEGIQTDSGNFTGIVTFTSSDGAELKARFKDDPALDTLTNLGLSVDTSHTPDFTTVSGNNGVKYNSDDTTTSNQGDSTNGIYKAEDDLGTSYYFRGAVEKNYVYFANKYWRIIRINGDGTIRMIYAGTSAHDNGYNDSSIKDTSIGTSAFNNDYNDNAYVGYMYGTPGSSTYAETHANTNDSTIKEYIDNWYQNNLSSYSQYIADAIYCNDRSVTPVDSFDGMTLTGTGIGTEDTAYSNLKRNWIDHTPSLKCTNINDRFTVENNIGNTALTYPVGLITLDELAMAGGVTYDVVNSSYITNTDYYLYTGYWYWTMTPDAFAGGGAGVDGVSSDGSLSDDSVNSDYAVRPVVSLKSDAITGGSGTSNDPFVVG